MTADLQALIRRAIADPGAVVAARRPDETGPAWSARAVEQTLLDAGWRSPLPDSETEWGCRDRHGHVHSVGVENETQARAMRSMTPVRREVGPWTEVQP